MSPEGSNLAPLAQLITDRLGGKTFIRERLISVGTSVTLILPNNPNRLAWELVNASGNSVVIAFSADLVVNYNGFTLANNGGFISMIYYDDGESVGQQVWGRSDPFTTSIYAREVLRE